MKIVGGKKGLVIGCDPLVICTPIPVEPDSCLYIVQEILRLVDLICQVDAVVIVMASGIKPLLCLVIMYVIKIIVQYLRLTMFPIMPVLFTISKRESRLLVIVI